MFIQPAQSYDKIILSRKVVMLTNVLLYIQFLFILMNAIVSLMRWKEHDRVAALTRSSKWCGAVLTL